MLRHALCCGCFDLDSAFPWLNAQALLDTFAIALSKTWAARWNQHPEVSARDQGLLVWTKKSWGHCLTCWSWERLDSWISDFCWSTVASRARIFSPYNWRSLSMNFSRSAARASDCCTRPSAAVRSDSAAKTFKAGIPISWCKISNSKKENTWSEFAFQFWSQAIDLRFHSGPLSRLAMYAIL